MFGELVKGFVCAEKWKGSHKVTNNSHVINVRFTATVYPENLPRVRDG